MPAQSKKQQRFMGMVHAAQKGEKPASPEIAKVAKEIPKKAAKDFASTKHKNLPEKKKEESINSVIREIIIDLLGEGTWAMPKNSNELNKAIKLKQQFKNLKKELYKYLGDDELFNHLDWAEYRIDELIRDSHDKLGVKK